MIQSQPTEMVTFLVGKDEEPFIIHKGKHDSFLYCNRTAYGS